MENKRPLLSICIPTYNRAEYLRGALENITSDFAFSSEVEVIISDNSSTDDTWKVGKEYSEKYENIHYFRNKTNIHDKNFIVVQQKAIGKYIRLFNDTLRFKKGALNKMLEIIKTSSENESLLIFQNIPFLHKNESCIFFNKESFLLNVSFYCTWIANWGCWKKDLQLLCNLSKYSYLKLQQVDWFFQLTELHDRGRIIFDDFFISLYPKGKGGYNYIEVFVKNYLFIIRENISDEVLLSKEKNRLFRFYLSHYIFNGIIYNSGQYSFETENAMKNIWSEYKTYFCFYEFIASVPYYFMRRKCKCIIKRICHI